MPNQQNHFYEKIKNSYEIPVISFVTMKIYDVLGKEISTLINREEPAGVHEFDFDAGKLASGIYLYKIKAGTFEQTRKMILLK